MGVIHKFDARKGLAWPGIPLEAYSNEAADQVTKQVLIGIGDGAANFEIRYFEVAPGGFTTLDEHAHDHGVIVLTGKGSVTLGHKTREVGFGDAIYVAPYERHQFRNPTSEPFGFICVIPPKQTREKE